jgi:hypothetical protein
MPVAIAGVHRSGTSLIARALSGCGLYLGDDNDLMPPAVGNDEGHWENLKFVEINDEILNEFGAGWDSPTDLPPNWHHDARLEAMRRKAVRLTDGFVGFEHWGWKDPRTSLTLPFWTSLLPRLQVVICVRNPLEVAHSLYARNGLSYALSLRLWHAYNDAILRAIPPEQRLVTHYESYFADAQREVERMLRFLTLDPPPDVLVQATQVVKPYLRHQRSSPWDLAAVELSQEIFALYEQMCAEAEWPHGALSRSQPSMHAPVMPIGRINLERVEVETLRRRVIELESHAALPGPASAEVEEVSAREAALPAPDATHAAELATLRETYETHLLRLQTDVFLLHRVIDEIRTSTAWRLVALLWRMRTWLVPHGGWREKTLRRMIHGRPPTPAGTPREHGVTTIAPGLASAVAYPPESRPAAGDVEFFMIAEEGILEAQALLLCKSIRRFAGAYSSSLVTVVSPRHSRRPSTETVKELDRLGVNYLALDVESCCPVYGTSFRVHTAGWLAQRSGPEILVQLDSDTLFLGEPDLSMCGATAAARPVDTKGMCTGGPGDPFDDYWRALCRLCEVDYDSVPLLETYVDRQIVRASYNGGLVIARRASGVFERTEEFFKRLVLADMRPHAGTRVRLKTGTGTVALEASEYWGSSQAALSLAVVASGNTMHLLPPSYNVPLPYFDVTGPPDVTAVHVHYHWMCTPEECATNPMLDGRLELPPDTLSWLREQLPLKAQ